MGDIFEEVPPYAASEERSEEDEERNQDEQKEQDSDSDSDMVTESEDEDVSDREIDDQDPWETLRQEVEESLNSTYDRKANTFLKEGVSEMRPKLSMPCYPFTEESCEGCTCTISSGLNV